MRSGIYSYLELLITLCGNRSHLFGTNAKKNSRHIPHFPRQADSWPVCVPLEYVGLGPEICQGSVCNRCLVGEEGETDGVEGVLRGLPIKNKSLEHVSRLAVIGVF